MNLNEFCNLHIIRVYIGSRLDDDKDAFLSRVTHEVRLTLKLVLLMWAIISCLPPVPVFIRSPNRLSDYMRRSILDARWFFQVGQPRKLQWQCESYNVMSFLWKCKIVIRFASLCSDHLSCMALQHGPKRSTKQSLSYSLSLSRCFSLPPSFSPSCSPSLPQLSHRAQTGARCDSR